MKFLLITLISFAVLSSISSKSVRKNKKNWLKHSQNNTNFSNIDDPNDPTKKIPGPDWIKPESFANYIGEHLFVANNTINGCMPKSWAEDPDVRANKHFLNGVKEFENMRLAIKPFVPLLTKSVNFECHQTLIIREKLMAMFQPKLKFKDKESVDNDKETSEKKKPKTIESVPKNSLIATPPNAPPAIVAAAKNQGRIPAQGPGKQNKTDKNEQNNKRQEKLKAADGKVFSYAKRNWGENKKVFDSIFKSRIMDSTFHFVKCLYTSTKKLNIKKIAAGLIKIRNNISIRDYVHPTIDFYCQWHKVKDLYKQLTDAKNAKEDRKWEQLAMAVIRLLHLFEA